MKPPDIFCIEILEANVLALLGVGKWKIKFSDLLWKFMAVMILETNDTSQLNVIVIDLPRRQI